MVVSAAGYFFSIITVFTTLMTFMALLIGLFDHSTFEKCVTIRTRALSLNGQLHRQTRKLIM